MPKDNVTHHFANPCQSCSSSYQHFYFSTSTSTPSTNTFTLTALLNLVTAWCSPCGAVREELHRVHMFRLFYLTEARLHPDLHLLLFSSLRGLEATLSRFPPTFQRLSVYQNGRITLSEGLDSPLMNIFPPQFMEGRSSSNSSSSSSSSSSR